MAETKYPSSFPDENVSADEKAKKWWNLQYCKAAYYTYQGLPQRAIGWRSADRYRLIKSYALGRQNTDIIQARVRRGKNAKDGNQKTDWRPWHVIPKFIGIATSILNKAREAYELQIRAIDASAQDEIADDIYSAKTKAIMREAHMQAGQYEATQTDVLRPKSGEPEDEEGCDLMALGARHFTDAEMEDIVASVFNANEYDNLKRLIDEDLLDTGVAGLKDDSDGTFISLRRIDPERLVLPYCHYADLSDNRYAGELIDLPVSSLLQMSSGQLDKEDIEQIFEIGRKPGANVYTSSIPANLNEFWAKGRVRLLDLEMLTTDELVREERTNRRGNMVFGKTRPEAKNIQNGEVKRKIVQRVYRCKWVVGTDICFDYGKQFNQKRDPLNKARTSLSYHIVTSKMYEMDAISRTEALIPFADAIMTAWFRLQNALNTVVPKGYEIDVGALEAVDLTAGGKAMTPKAIIDFFFETGILVSRSQNQGQPGSQRRAIIPLEGGVGSEIAEFWTLITNNIELMRQTLGLNELTDGSTPNPKLLNGVASLASAGTNNALADLFHAGKKLESSVAKAIVTRAQSIYRSEGKTAFIGAYGKCAAAAVGKISNISKYIYSAEIEDMPTEQEEAQFNQDLTDAITAGQITIADRIKLRTVKNVQKRQAQLTYMVKKNAEQKQKEAIALQTTNAQVQQQSAQQASQLQQQVIAAQLAADKERITLEKDLEFRNERAKGAEMLEGKKIDGASRVEGFNIMAEERAQRGTMDNHTDLIKAGMGAATDLHKVNTQAATDHMIYEATQAEEGNPSGQPAPQQPASPLPVQPVQAPQQPGFSFLNQPQTAPQEQAA